MGKSILVCNCISDFKQVLVVKRDGHTRLRFSAFEVGDPCQRVGGTGLERDVIRRDDKQESLIVTALVIQRFALHTDKVISRWQWFFLRILQLEVLTVDDISGQVGIRLPNTDRLDLRVEIRHIHLASQHAVELREFQRVQRDSHRIEIDVLEVHFLRTLGAIDQRRPREHKPRIRINIACRERE